MSGFALDNFGERDGNEQKPVSYFLCFACAAFTLFSSVTSYNYCQAQRGGEGKGIGSLVQ